MNFRSLALLLAIAAAAIPAHAVAGGQRPAFRKVFVIMLENAYAGDALRQPYLKSLIKRGSYLANFRAVGRPSQANYIALTSGSTQGVETNQAVNLDARHIGDLLEARDKRWRQYAAGYPGGCFLTRKSGRYARKHAPFLSYTNVQRDPVRCARTVNASQLDKDIADGRLADFSLYIPDMDEDGHDTGLAYADRWLAGEFDARFKDPRFMKDMLVVITFDEDDGHHGNHIYALLLGDGVVPGSTARGRYDFFSLLRTVEDTLGLGTLGKHDASAAPITGIWR